MDRCKRILVPLVLLVALVAGCKKKVSPPPAQTTPPAVQPAPTAQISATPAAVNAGESTVLTWSTTNATEASIDGLGAVATSGVKTVTPASSMTYRLMAKGPGGSTDASVHVTVTVPPAAAAAAPAGIDEDAEFRANVKDIFFNYDAYDLSSEAQTTLANDAKYLLAHPQTKILIGGYCDERGSNEYNLVLGQNRAESAKKSLIDAGVEANRIRTISYGKEKPFCTESNESCWQMNRRAGFSRDRTTN